MAFDEDGFMAYLQLQDSSDLVTKSELISEVRSAGNSVSDRQLTFYVSEGLIPKSVRVGTRAGVYPRIVVELLSWILTARDRGVPIEAIKELTPVWKFLVRARRERRMDLMELEYIARQHVTGLEGVVAVPMLVGDVLTGYCPPCRGDIKIVRKDRVERSIDDVETTVGFAFAQRSEDESGKETYRWVGQTHLTFAYVQNFHEDPTTVLLGIRPNEALPPIPGVRHSSHATEGDSGAGASPPTRDTIER
jgi:DNA-binding transcriptional MerR regulator